jgi:ribonuclease HI
MFRVNVDKFLEIFCDGACSGNPGPGGWGAVLIWNDTIKVISGYEPKTTNNRMELLAAIKALEAITRPVKVKMFTDSKYLQDGITKWINSWKRNNWKNGKVLNRDLWERLDILNHQHQIEWNWVKGHNGNKYNEMADKAARDAITENCG